MNIIDDAVEEEIHHGARFKADDDTPLVKAFVANVDYISEYCKKTEVYSSDLLIDRNLIK